MPSTIAPTPPIGIAPPPIASACPQIEETYPALLSPKTRDRSLGRAPIACTQTRRLARQGRRVVVVAGLRRGAPLEDPRRELGEQDGRRELQLHGLLEGAIGQRVAPRRELTQTMHRRVRRARAEESGG